MSGHAYSYAEQVPMRPDVLLTVCLGLGVLAVAVTLRWTVMRVDALGRPRPFPAATVGISAAAAVLCAVPIIRHAQLESRLADVAGVLAGHKVTVRCETVGQTWLEVHPERGYVQFGADGVPERHAVITYDTCQDLADWVRSDHSEATEDQMIAVHVLTHEAMHMRGITNEAEAECAALQRDRQTGLLLGANLNEAQALVRRYLLTVYPQMPDAYRSGECRPGGAMDEQLENSPWA
ncbi:MAG: hypothetical protein WAL50_15570 [Kineosporiaceae bacterium]